MTGDGSSVDRPGTGDGASIAPALMRAVADAAETSPYEFSALNDTVDPDALTALFDPDGDSPSDADDAPTAVVALEIDGRIATVESDGSVAATDRSNAVGVAEALGLIDDAAVATARHRWAGPQSLLSTVVSTVAAAADADPVAVRDAFAAVLDQQALNALFRPRGNGVSRGEGGLRVPFREYDVVILSDGTVSVQPTLTRINRTGGNLLVVGSVPRGVSDATSRALLGSADDRARVVAVHGHDVGTATDRLDALEADPARTLVVDHGDGSRSVAAAETETASRRPPVRPVEGDLDALAAELGDAVETLEEACGGLAPGQLRVCLDSLGSMRSRYDRAAVRDFLETVTDRVERASGIAHYVMLADRDSEHVRGVEDLFDVVVELRVGANGPEQRWHVRETGHSTEWFRTDADGTGL